MKLNIEMEDKETIVTKDSLDSDKMFVSICIPTYNSSYYIRETLDSVVRQTYKNSEIIVSDNASTDNTEDIVNEYVKKYGIKYYRSLQNTGAATNFNKCIKLSSGDSICIYHSDDIYEPDIVARSAQILIKHKNVGAVFTMANIIDERGNTIGQLSMPKTLKRLEKDFYSFDEILSNILKYGNSFLITPTVMVRRYVYEEVGGWDYETHESAADLGLWLKIAQKYDVAIIDSSLVKYRISAVQESYMNIRQRVEQADYFLVMDEYTPKMKGREFEKYYNIHKIRDMIYRAFNLSAHSHSMESNSLIKHAFTMYFDNFLKIALNLNTLGSLLIAIFLWVVNKIPSDKVKTGFKNFVFVTNRLRKRTVFFLKNLRI